MTTAQSIAAIYDFELFPYALGDVLTWNVRTAMRCEELGRQQVDIYICADEQCPAGIYQRGLVNPQNFELFFSELFDAFGTHPRLGNIHIFRKRDALLERLQEIVLTDEINAEAVNDYLDVLGRRVDEGVLDKIRRAIAGKVRGNQRLSAVLHRFLPESVKDAVRQTCFPSEDAINSYFIKYIHSHERINAYAERHGGIPLLHPVRGCAPDIEELFSRRFAGKKVVPFHLRLRRLDFGYGGAHSYDRDSDFLEWYDFLAEAASRYPDVQFVTLGRLQEKPLELLKLPNVMSLRLFGMGLGHELTLMLRSDLFIGTSSGFAALANFSTLPYFITHMNPGSCFAYAIEEGAERLPFAQRNQKLIYERESSGLLMRLLETGLGIRREQEKRCRAEAGVSGPQKIDVGNWLAARSRPVNSAATTCRFSVDDAYCGAETAYLLLPSLERARQEWSRQAREEARAILGRMEENFPELCARMPQYLSLAGLIAAETGDAAAVQVCVERLKSLGADEAGERNIQLLNACLGADSPNGQAKRGDALGALRAAFEQSGFEMSNP